MCLGAGGGDWACLSVHGVADVLFFCDRLLRRASLLLLPATCAHWARFRAHTQSYKGAKEEIVKVSGSVWLTALGRMRRRG